MTSGFVFPFCSWSASSLLTLPLNDSCDDGLEEGAAVGALGTLGGVYAAGGAPVGLEPAGGVGPAKPGGKAFAATRGWRCRLGWLPPFNPHR